MMWSWILTIVGVTGFVLAGRKVWWAWYINIACQALWLTYAIVTSQYGFIAGAAVYTVVFSQNAIRWTKEHYSPSRRMREPFENPRPHCLHHPVRVTDLVTITNRGDGKTHYLCQPCFALTYEFFQGGSHETPEAQP